MSPGAIVGPIIIAIGLVAAAIVFAIASHLLAEAGTGPRGQPDVSATEVDADRSDIDQLQSALADVQRDVKNLRADLDTVQAKLADAEGVSPPIPPDADVIDGEHPVEAPIEPGVPDLARFNEGLSSPRNATMIELLGHPRGDYSIHCQSVTNPRLSGLLERRDFGRFRVTMIRPAIESLERIMEQVRANERDLHQAIGTAGALCARLVRGSTRSISNHSWGTAIDIKLAGELDGFGDGSTQFGLVLLAEAFNDEGWYWGAAYGREDSMHFEVAEETLRRWHDEGRL